MTMTEAEAPGRHNAGVYSFRLSHTLTSVSSSFAISGWQM